MAKDGYLYVKAWRAKPENKAKVAAQARRYRRLHRDLRKAIEQRHRERHLDKIRERDAAAQRRRRKLDPEGNRRRQLEFKARVEAKLLAQTGRPRPSRCELCEIEAKTVFDHDHVTGEFRGWLCHRCNRTLGQVKDSISLLLKMADYLHRGGIGGQINSGEAQEPSEVTIRSAGQAGLPFTR